MDNNYFTEKISPKNKPVQENTETKPQQTAPANIIQDLSDFTEHRQNHPESGEAPAVSAVPAEKAAAPRAEVFPQDLTEHRRIMRVFSATSELSARNVLSVQTDPARSVPIARIDRTDRLVLTAPSVPREQSERSAAQNLPERRSRLTRTQWLR